MQMLMLIFSIKQDVTIAKVIVKQSTTFAQQNTGLHVYFGSMENSELPNILPFIILGSHLRK